MKFMDKREVTVHNSHRNESKSMDCRGIMSVKHELSRQQTKLESGSEDTILEEHRTRK